MLIREWMTKDVITVTPDTSMLKASKLMKDHNIRRLPVLDGKHVASFPTGTSGPPLLPRRRRSICTSCIISFPK